MKLYGDVLPEDHIKVKQLQIMEKWFIDNSKNVKPDIIAMAFTSLSHDWYYMGMDEEGDRLLMAAENHFPRYFKEQVFQHVELNSDFKILYEKLTTSLSPELMKFLGPTSWLG